jgi:hypothetical protein
MTNDANARFHRINGEMLDTIDEELEMEIDDDRLAKLLTSWPSILSRRRSIVASTSRSCFACKASW